MKKRKRPPMRREERDWRITISLVVTAVLCTWAWSQYVGRVPGVQQAQMMQELLEEIDKPEPVTEEEFDDVPAVPDHEGPLRSIHIEGPIDVIVGDPVHLRVRTDGPAKSYAWSVTPEDDGLFVLDGGASAIFTNRNAQPYVVYVSAADSQGNIAQDTHTFEIVARKDALTLSNLSEANPDPTVQELVDYYVAEVRSEDKARETRVIAQSFRQVANLLRSGAIQPGQDIPAVSEKAIEVVLTPAVFAKWEIFFQRTRTLLNDYAAKGHLDSRDAWINTMENLASILESRG